MQRKKADLSQSGRYVLMIIISFLVLAPLMVIFFGAFKTHQEFYKSNPLALPKSFLNFENFYKVFKYGKLLRGFRNTLFILVISLTGSILCGTSVSYVLSRFEFRGKKLLQDMFLFAALVPAITMQVSVFQVISDMHLFNTLWAPIVLYIGTDIIAIYIFMHFIDNIPPDLDEAAMLDGASRFVIFRKIIFPLLKPAIVTVMIINGVGIYNDFYTAFLYIPSAKLATISTTLFKFKSQYGSQYEVICAGVIIIIIPVLILFIRLQNYIYDGLVMGSVK
jgi:raffinose/stachyose/melibiose transport system permease protein